MGCIRERAAHHDIADKMRGSPPFFSLCIRVALQGMLDEISVVMFSDKVCCLVARLGFSRSRLYRVDMLLLVAER